jgi:hypothetical protein
MISSRALRAFSRTAGSAAGLAASARQVVSASRNSTHRRSAGGSVSLLACSYSSCARENDFSAYCASASRLSVSYALPPACGGLAGAAERRVKARRRKSPV